LYVVKQKLSTSTGPDATVGDGLVTIFANPIAGRGRGTALAARIVERLKNEGFATRLFLDRPADVAKEHVAPQGAATIVIGGDGTLRAVIERFYLDDATLPPLLVVPMGTANLMGRHLGMKWTKATLERVVMKSLRKRHVVDMDCAVANGRALIVMAGVGFDAQVVQAVGRNRRGPIWYASYVWPTLGAFATYAFPEIEVSVDGQHVFGPAPGLAFIGNIREYGTGFPVLPDAKPDDQLLDVCVLPCAGKADLIKWATLAAVGKHVGAPGCVYIKAKSVRVTSSRSAPVQIDGEDAGTTPLEVRLLPQAVRFFLPGEGV